MSPNDENPPPALKCKPFVQVGDFGDATLPRPFLYTDGDGTNLVINVGLRIAAESCDDLLTVGMDLRLPPWLFWLADPILRLVGR